MPIGYLLQGSKYSQDNSDVRLPQELQDDVDDDGRDSKCYLDSFFQESRFSHTHRGEESANTPCSKYSGTKGT